MLGIPCKTSLLEGASSRYSRLSLSSQSWWASRRSCSLCPPPWYSKAARSWLGIEWFFFKWNDECVINLIIFVLLFIFACDMQRSWLYTSGILERFNIISGPRLGLLWLLRLRFSFFALVNFYFSWVAWQGIIFLFSFYFFFRDRVTVWLSPFGQHLSF